MIAMTQGIGSDKRPCCTNSGAPAPDSERSRRVIRPEPERASAANI